MALSNRLAASDAAHDLNDDADDDDSRQDGQHDGDHRTQGAKRVVRHRGESVRKSRDQCSHSGSLQFLLLT